MSGLSLRCCLSLMMFPAAVVSAEEPTKLVAFGDSTTATRGALRIYAQILQEDLPAKDHPVLVVNAGVGGHNTNHARSRFERDVLAQQADIVVIQFGINDAAVDVWKKPAATNPRVSLEIFEKNLQHFVRTLKSRKARVVLMTPNPLRWTPKMRELYGQPPYDAQDPDGFNILLKHYAEKVRDLSRTEDVPVIDVYQLFEDYGSHEGQTVSDLLLDGIHPNARGHQLIADRLMKVVLQPAQTE